MSSAAATTYRKRSGHLAVDSDSTHLTWTEGGTSSPAVKLLINDIVSEFSRLLLKQHSQLSKGRSATDPSWKS